MNKVWMGSDWHLSHDRDFVWGKRGFANVQEMNEAIVRNHNSLVDDEDDVWVLGDLCLGGGSAEAAAANKALIESMNGRLHIVIGNHDSPVRIEMYKTCKNVVEVVDAKWLHYKKYHFFLSHFPCASANRDQDKPLKARVINICGHSHTEDPFADWDRGFINYHVEMDSHNYYPILLDNIIEEIKKKLNG